MAPTKPSIALIVSSTRKPRVCPQIADFVKAALESVPTFTSSADFNIIDLATWNLPMFDEPTIPSQIKDPADYAQPHTRAWSAEISKHDAFIFILPQYNWGYPAALKNALDYLFHEWTNKAALIVSYGGHGGVKAATQLRQVLEGLKMRLTETMPALYFPDRPFIGKAVKGEELELERGDIWEKEKEDIKKGWEELIEFASGAEVLPKE